jgi:hypothetical protein
MISSPLMDKPYSRLVPDYDVYRGRAIPAGDSAPPSSPDKKK